MDTYPNTPSRHKSPSLPSGVFVREWRPGGIAKGAFLLLHGMESHSSWFGEIAVRLVAEGWAVVAPDRAGWGRSRGIRGHMGSYRDFVEETARLASFYRDRYGTLHLGGMSWGGMASLYLGLRRGWLFDSITMITPGLVARRDLGLGDKLRVACDFFRKNLSGMVSPRFEPEHFTRVPRWREYVADDPDRVRRVSTSFCVETLKMRRFVVETAGRRRLPPAACLLAGDDAIIDNDATAALCKKAGATVEVLPGAAHSLVFERPGETAACLLAQADAVERTRRDGARRRIWIAGGGAVGGTMAALLHFGGQEVGVLTKDAYVDRLRRGGIRLHTGYARRRTGPGLAVAATPEELPQAPDLVVLAVKSFDTDGVLATLRGALPPETVVASLQNGVGNEEKIARVFPDHTIVAGSICAGLELVDPGVTSWPDDRGGLAGARYQGDEKTAEAVWRDCMTATGMECLWATGANASQRLKWSKLMLNIGFNALNSVTGQTSAMLLGNQEYGCLAVQALREGFSVMSRLFLEPIDLPGFPVSKMRWLVKTPLNFARKLMAWQAGRAPEAAFSMRQDMQRHRQYTEINELNGIVVQHGLRLGVPVGANEKLVDMVRNI